MAKQPKQSSNNFKKNDKKMSSKVSHSESSSVNNRVEVSQGMEIVEIVPEKETSPKVSDPVENVHAQSTDMPIEIKPSDLNESEKKESVGQSLKKARRALSLTIPQVAAKIHIRKLYIEALENDQYEKLPGEVYVIGFVRTYAGFLAIDQHELIARLVLPAASKPVSTREIDQYQSRPTGGIIAIALVLLAAIGGFFYWKTHKDVTVAENSAPEAGELKNMASLPKTAGSSAESSMIVLKEESSIPTSTNENADESTHVPELLNTENSIKSVTSTPTESPQVAEKPAELPTNDTNISAIAKPKADSKILTSVPSANPNAVALKAQTNSWIELKQMITLEDGKVVEKVLHNKTLQKGEVLEIPTKENVVLTTGNAGTLELFKGDKSYGVLGKRGEVKRNVPATFDNLSTLGQKSESAAPQQ